MNAEVVSVGTELLLGQIVDTHAPRMARILAECGVGCQRRLTIGDNMDRLVAALRESLQRADIVVAIGGLGPTDDDLTRDAIAAALDDNLEFVPEYAEELEEFFASRGLKISKSTLRQAEKPTCARLIDNPHGTAPGLFCEKGGKRVVALPGPPGEFTPMADGPVREYLRSLTSGDSIRSRTLRICGLGESMVEDRVREHIASQNPTVAPYAHTGEVHLRVTARAASADEAEGLIQPMVDRLAAILGENLYGFDETTLEEVVIHAAVDRGATICVAESMTGGMLGMRLTNAPGSSKAFVGGILAYNAKIKRELLGVSESTLANFGPVSAECAAEMATSAKERLASTFAVAITGNAGPDVDDGDAPVGRTFVAVAGPSDLVVDRFDYRGVRGEIRARATQLALNALRMAIRTG